MTKEVTPEVVKKEEPKAERVYLPPPEHTCFLTMRSVTRVRTMIMASGHADPARAAGASTGSEADMRMVQHEAQQKALASANIKVKASKERGTYIGAMNFARGVNAVHKPSGKKVTVVRANTGRSRTGAPMHTVVFRNGDSRKVSEKNLQLL